MTPDELSRAICQFKEPVEGLPPVEFYEVDEKSPLSFWRVIYTDALEYKWRHRDMVYDPAMTLVLLKELLAAGYYPQGATLRNIRLTTVEFGPGSWYTSHPIADLGLAVAEAWARVFGVWRD